MHSYPIPVAENLALLAEFGAIYFHKVLHIVLF